MLHSLGAILVYALPLASSAKIARAPRQSLPSYNYNVIESSIDARQIPSIVVNTGGLGGQGPNGTVPLRLEIRELMKNSDMWTLYILGLDRMQNVDQNELLSWYQIGGIHGSPHTPYDGVPPKPGNENHGYCVHVSQLFPTWHRAYLALYEQALYGTIQTIAKAYPEGPIRERYVNAASNFRIPYWDWASAQSTGNQTQPQDFGLIPNVKIDGPAGTQMIANPLYSYKFHPLNASDFEDDPFNKYPATVRYPTGATASASSQNNIFEQVFNSTKDNIRSRVYALLTNYHDYLGFSNDGYRKEAPPNEQDSLESIHNLVHNLIGGNGHMTYIDYSAFDPFFFLHHTAIDRIFALWQVLNPDSYITSLPAVTNSYTIVAGEIQDINSPLTPFFKDTSGNFWTSAGLRDTRSMGYNYPETWNPDPAVRRKDVITAVNTLYGPGVSSPKMSFDALSISESGKYREWVANIQMYKHGLSAPYSVFIFLGPSNPDPNAWSSDPNLAGLHTTFVRSVSHTKDFEPQNSPIVTAAIPLTQALFDHIGRGELDSLSVEDVTPWLEENLHYRVSLLNSTEVSGESVPGLKVFIASADMKLPTEEDEMPVWGEMKEHMQVIEACRTEKL
ncbi:BgTH12-06091 [Blumeria graminis f. sp. triticale]|uniref:BgTH12-06091 n=1 Tax=Blumeria graminis f. sp. triticale TaxID=1689686 RepID=A0A9W4DAM0_BLUGR|nr:BgTH12-06091 [Blumeria graminis f. sp. triticale]